MQFVLQGNAVEAGRDFNQWLVGDLPAWCARNGAAYDPARHGLLNSTQVEVKWGFHPVGQARPGGWTGGAGKISLSILVRGSFRIRFRDPAHPEVETQAHLRREGDFAVWDEAAEHTWLAEAESVIVTVRWLAKSGEFS